MSYECFELTMSEGIAHIRFNRPEKANSMVPSFWTELPHVVKELSRDASARVIVLSASRIGVGAIAKGRSWSFKLHGILRFLAI